ncbi:nitrate/nitrite transporter [Bacteroidota bacterium]
MKRNSILASLVFAGEAVFFLPFVMARIFRPTLLNVFDISNTELGSYFSVYGIIAMISYIFGGVLADRVSSRILMALALWLTSLGGFIMIFIPPSSTMYIIYGFWGFTTIFLFWAAMIRTTREWGGSDFQGRAFGWLEGGRGAVAATLGTIAFVVFSIIVPDAQTELVPDNKHAFQMVVLVISLLTVVAGIIIWIVLPDKQIQLRQGSPELSLAKVKQLAKNPVLWMLSIIIICAYSGYKITDDFSLYAREVLGFSETGAAGIGTLALWLRAIVAIAAGYLGDRVKRTHVIQFSFILILLSALLTASGWISQVLALILMNIALTAVGIYAVRALYFSVFNEAGIPMKLTGTTVGIVSFLGFAPDVYMSPWMGHMLDNNPGETGHQLVFLVLGGFAFVGMIMTFLFGRYSAKLKEQ